MRRKLTVTLLTSLILFSFWQLAENVSAQQPLTLAAILTGLQTKGNKPETATLAARNVYITKRVESLGVTFRLTTEIEKELRNAGASTILIAAIRSNGPSATPTPRVTNSTPSASFKEIWIDYGVTEGGENGMRIHVKFTAYGMKNLDSYLAIYFIDEDGNYLKDNNRKFNSSSGDVAVYRDLRPGYDPAEYADFSVFMPYSELDLPNGNWDLKMDVKLIYKAGGLISELTKKPFNYKKGASVNNNKNSDDVTFKVTRKWIDYNVSEDGVKGMRIHVHFEVTGLRGVDSLLAVRVMKENGDILMNSNSSYSNNDGELEVAFSMKPGFETTVYKDADVFLPYNQIIVSRGKWDLKLDIDLKYADGTLIKHMDVYPFEFERP